MFFGPVLATPLWAPLGLCGPGNCGPPWAPVGQGALPVGLAIMGQAVMAGPLWAPWALMCQALMGQALMGQALMGRALMGPAPMAAMGQLLFCLFPSHLVQSNECLIRSNLFQC